MQGPAQLIGIFACFLQNPCDDNHKIVKTSSTIPTQNIGLQSNQPRVPYTATTTTEVDQTQNPIYSTSQLAYAYKFWQIDNTYRRRMMQIQMPIAKLTSSSYEPTSTCIALCSPQQRWVLQVHAERVNEWPEFPDPGALPAWPQPSPPPGGYSPPIVTVLSYKLKPGTPQFTATGQSLYRATMQLVIALSRPLLASEALSLGNDKWSNKGLVTTSGTLTSSSW